MQLGQLGGQLVEVVEGRSVVCPAPPPASAASDIGERRLRQSGVTEVRTVDPQRGEPIGQPLDLPAELVGGEPALTELVRQRVRGGRQEHAGVGELAEQPGHQHGVARIVEFELVDGQQPVTGQPLHRFAEPERSDQMGVLDEGAVRLRSGYGMPQRRQQVGLSDAESTVEIDTGRRGGGRLAEPALLRRVRRSPAASCVSSVNAVGLRRSAGSGR